MRQPFEKPSRGSAVIDRLAEKPRRRDEDDAIGRQVAHPQPYARVYAERLIGPRQMYAASLVSVIEIDLDAALQSDQRAVGGGCVLAADRAADAGLDTVDAAHIERQRLIAIERNQKAALVGMFRDFHETCSADETMLRSFERNDGRLPLCHGPSSGGLPRELRRTAKQSNKRALAVRASSNQSLIFERRAHGAHRCQENRHPLGS